MTREQELFDKLAAAHKRLGILADAISAMFEGLDMTLPEVSQFNLPASVDVTSYNVKGFGNGI